MAWPALPIKLATKLGTFNYRILSIGLRLTLLVVTGAIAMVGAGRYGIVTPLIALGILCEVDKPFYLMRRTGIG